MLRPKPPKCKTLAFTSLNHFHKTLISPKFLSLTTFHDQTQQLQTQILEPNFTPTILDSNTYTNLLKFSIESKNPILGKLVHTHLIKTCSHQPLFLQNNLVNMYCKCGKLDNARKVFDRMLEPDVISWNSLVSGYSQLGLYEKSINVFKEARRDSRVELDKFSYASALCVCSRTGDVELGKMVHGLIVVSGLSRLVFLTNLLIDMYSKCSCVDDARVVFENSYEVDDVSWNSLIAGYAQMGLYKRTLDVFVRMHRDGFQLNSFALGSVLKACCSCFNGSILFGKMLHGCIVKLGLDVDVVVMTALLDMYSKIGDFCDAIRIFRLMSHRNVIMYNAMIAGFSRLETDGSEELSEESMILFAEMLKEGLKPTKFTFSSILKACNAVEAFEYGKQLHAQIHKYKLQSDEFIGSGLVELYSISGLSEDGLRCFHATPRLDIVSWTSMIAVCVRNGQFEQALRLFCEALAFKMKPDEYTISITLSACANLAAERSGEQIQGHAVKTGFGQFKIVGNSQICMYAKSGDIDAAELTFKEMENCDLVSWSVMISSHAQHGCASDALSLFEVMKGCDVAPNLVTYLGVLTACSHGGLVAEGLWYFESMKSDHGLKPNAKHCACIVDLLGRAGRLADAENFIMSSGFKVDPVMWRALLGACRIHGDIVTGKRIAERVIELEPQAAASYVLLYNIYSDAGIQLPATNIRDLMKDRGVKKEPGLSWIQVSSSVHSFVVGDKSHLQRQSIYRKLEEMLEKIEKIGYVSQQESKNSLVVNYHSEKLAVSFGMISLPKSAPIRVMKNLRVCPDCHTMMKFVSKAESREIVLRDPIRFHRFRDGSCSCRDYW
ncbi:hypothetical protein GIB67_000254 [Kingdonia uniflora]|uniref:DYW domain-containing protein n=1 Tax=Kingdonia uniflora TaxID=39325 RepID=A0A7J7LC12_9MAGN|nr:hypothetical protein GIB67_000254 [Kingdonia uniflora]